MDPDSCMILSVILYVFFLLAGMFFALSETAIIAFSDAKLKVLVEKKDPKALRLKKLTDQPIALQNTAQLGFTLCSLAAGTFSVLLFHPLFYSLLGSLHETAKILLGGVLSFLLSLLILFTVCKRTPYLVASHHPDRIAYATTRPMLFLIRFLKPLVWLFSAFANLFSRLFGVDPRSNPEAVTEEEIRMMMDVGNERGVIEQSQMDMINNIFEFDDTSAGDVMTHRTEVVAVSTDVKISELVYIAVNEGFSRIPVYEDDIDDIVGAVYVKDLLSLIGVDSTDDFAVQDFIRPVLYVPKSVKCRELFKELTAKKAHLAIVVDEYGGTSGIITMEDLLESIVGNIQDEYDNEEEEVTKVNDRVFTFDGGTELEDVGKALDTVFEESEDYDTIGGLLIHLLGHIPAEDEEVCVTVNDIEFTVLLVEDRRIMRVKAIKPEVLSPEEEETTLVEEPS